MLALFKKDDVLHFHVRRVSRFRARFSLTPDGLGLRVDKETGLVKDWLLLLRLACLGQGQISKVLKMHSSLLQERGTRNIP